jgi:response regulator RpfG family c-di-GMP phosphodiesterase
MLLVRADASEKIIGIGNAFNGGSGGEVLPLAAMSPPARVAVHAATEERGLASPKTVLVVDDEHNALVALAKILREDGYHVVVAATEEQALERLDHWTFDFIITDLFLLHHCCVNLLKKIKEMEPRIPVILTTAHGDVDRYIDESSLEGMIYLSKPIKYDELRDKIMAIEGSCPD